jgi:hypothetical protein
MKIGGFMRLFWQFDCGDLAECWWRLAGMMIKIWENGNED